MSKGWAGTHRVPYYVWFLLLLFATAFVWRMQHVTSWPMPFHPMLQYENALNTRALYYHWKGDTASAEEKCWLTGYQGRWKGVPLIEGLTALQFLMVGQELTWVSCIWTSVLWIIAGLFLYFIACKHLQSSWGAFAAVAFFLLHPFSMVISRSFQHEAAQVAGFLLAWWWLARHDAYSKGSSLFLAGLISGMALLLKPGIGWVPLCFIHLAYGVQRHGWKETLTSWKLYIFPVISLLPSLIWVKFVMPGDETHQWKWFLLGTSTWYSQTWSQLTSVIGWPGIVVLFIVTGWHLSIKRWFVPLVLLGSIIFIMLFSYAAMTHDYYLIVFLPVVALTWGEFLVWFKPVLMRMMRDSDKANASMFSWGKANEELHGGGYYRIMPYLFVLFLTVALGHLLSNYSVSLLRAEPYQPERNISQQLGQELGTGTQVIALCSDYAMPLRYFSGLHAQWWPTQNDLWYETLDGSPAIPAEDRLQKMEALKKPCYFIITRKQEYQQQPDLVAVLQRYPERKTSIVGVRIFELTPKQGGEQKQQQGGQAQ